ncbi:MAG: UvrD-helicase domain-containing protein [Planctomycetaceae bacterium]|nr:UvrD-helicase domain-containing protein [Planctomycetaceae bacterium]
MGSAVIEARQTHRLIRASAGTGKTFQLSGHFLRQLFEGNAPETILATTFTRKAAGEILGRVLLRLADAAADQDAAITLRQQLGLDHVNRQAAAELLVSVTRQLHRMRICTLDSFFQQVARSLTLELGLTPGWSIVDEHIDAELRQQAVDAVLSQHVALDSRRLMQMLARGRAKRSIRDLINETVDSYYDLYQLTRREAWDQIQVPQRLTTARREQLIRDLYACDLPPDSKAIAARSRDVEQYQAGNWEAYLSSGLSAVVFKGGNTYYRKPLPDDLIEVYRELNQHAIAEILDQLARQTKATWDLISRFDKEYSRLRAEHGWMRFGDVTRALAMASREASGDRMSFRLDGAIRHLLLDEFQDTSVDQWKILKRLAASVDAQYADSSFFCVGDGKQAIYRWRGGVAEILDAVARSIPGITQSSMDESRRSSVPVIETVNRVFETIRQQVVEGDDEDASNAIHEWSKQFPHHSAWKVTEPGYAELRSSPDFEGENVDEIRTEYYRWAAIQIQELYQQTPHAEIGVLVRRNSVVARLVHELAILGVPASEEGGTPPVDSAAVLAVMSLLHFASHPGCTVSRYHIVNSPLAALVGLSDWDDDEAAARVAANVRDRLMNDGYGRTLQSLADGVRPWCNLRDQLRLQQIVSEGWRFDDAPSLNPADFVEMLENTRLSRSQRAPVRVMTVHQSKGLEFDVVVLPELDADMFRPPTVAIAAPDIAELPDRVCVWRNKQIRRILPEHLREACRQTQDGQIREALCLLYVALTRAVHSLHMLVRPGSRRNSFSQLLFKSLGKEKWQPEETLFETGDPEWYLRKPEFLGKPQSPTLPSLARSGAVERTTISVALSVEGRRRGLIRRAPSRHDETRLYFEHPASAARGRSVSSGDHGPDASTATASIDPRARGTLIHAWFEQLHWLDNSPEPSDEHLLQIAEQQFISRRVAIRMLGEFRSFLNSPGVRGIFLQSEQMKVDGFRWYATDFSQQRVHLSCQMERPFLYQQSGELISGTIDRLVLLSDGHRYLAADIVDFKTDRLVGDVNSWIADRRGHYRSQLQDYRAAVSHCFRIAPELISCRLLFLAADRVESIAIDDPAPSLDGSGASKSVLSPPMSSA